MIILDFVARVLVYGGGLIALAFLMFSTYDFHRQGLARVKAYNDRINKETENS